MHNLIISVHLDPLIPLIPVQKEIHTMIQFFNGITLCLKVYARFDQCTLQIVGRNRICSIRRKQSIVPWRRYRTKAGWKLYPQCVLTGVQPDLDPIFLHSDRQENGRRWR